jgi:hypothetical protein
MQHMVGMNICLVFVFVFGPWNETEMVKIVSLDLLLLKIAKAEPINHLNFEYDGKCKSLIVSFCLIYLFIFICL